MRKLYQLSHSDTIGYEVEGLKVEGLKFLDFACWTFNLQLTCPATSHLPMHALSIPTWIIHVSSVIEWIAAIWLIWTYGEVKRDRTWWGLSFAMLPALVSAMCACTWHFFDNPASLEWLVTLQASMTVLGNITLCAAAWLIWRSAQKPNLKNTTTRTAKDVTIDAS